MSNPRFAMPPLIPLALLVLLILATLGVGLFRPGDRIGDFFLAGRRAGTVSVGASLTATCLGASATVGLVGRAYEMGWSAFWWLGSGAVGLVLLGVFFVKPMRERVGLRTLPEWLGTRYGLPARVLAALLIILMWVGVISAQWVAAGGILGGMLGVPTGWAIAGAAAVVVAYTAAGGQFSVLRTDILQVLLIAIALFVPLLLLTPPGDAATGAALSGPASAGVPVHQMLALVFVVGGMYVVGPDLCSRVLTAKGNREASRGAWLAACALLVASVAVVSLGLRIRAVGIQPEESRNALAALLSAEGVLPGPLALAVQIGLLGALLSSADTCLHTAASVCVLDVVPSRHSECAPPTVSRRALGARGAVVVIGFAAAAVAHWHPGIIRNILLAYSFYAGGLLVPLLLMACPGFAVRIPRTVVWLTIVAGGFLPVCILLWRPGLDYAVAGSTGCLLSACILVPAGMLQRGVRRQ